MKLDNRLWIIGPVLVLFLWWLLTAFDLIQPIFLASPIEVARAIFKLSVQHESNLWVSVLVTLLRALSGLCIGLLIGLPAGLVLGYFTRAYNIMHIPLDFFRSIPVTALFPFFLLAFGVGNQFKIAVVVWAVSLITIINMIYGVRSCSVTRKRYLRSIGARSWQTIIYQILPESAPNIIGGIRISISQAFIVVIVTEMFFGGNNGIGYMLYNSALLYKTDEVIAIILVTGCLGYCVNKFAEKWSDRIVFWKN